MYTYVRVHITETYHCNNNMSTPNGNRTTTPLNITDDTTIGELLEEMDVLLSSFKTMYES